MKKCLLFFGFGLLLIAGCSGPKPLEPQRSVVAGEIVNMTENTPNFLEFYTDNPYADRRQGITVWPEETGWKFHLERDLLFTQDIGVRFGTHYMALYMNPGDSVYLTIDGRFYRREGGVEFSGDNAETNRQLRQWLRFSRGIRLPLDIDNMTTIEAVRPQIYANIRLYEDSLQSFIERYAPGPEAIDWIRCENVFSAANDIVMYRGEDAYL